MKKIITALLVICLCMGLAACGNAQTDNGNAAKNETVAENETTETGDMESEQAAEDGENESSEENKASESEAESTPTTLVVYFSATGNTQAIAEIIADGMSANIYEIIAEVPYTEADLDYGDNNSRSTIEMNDPSVRPGISGMIESIEQYDIIYIGYPIWWGEAPRILDTFVESHDFTDKTVIPFCTSASSGMGASARGLEELAGNGNWLNGKRFSGSESAETVMEWANGL